MAGFNEDYDHMCPYCKEDESTADHIRWKRKHFQPQGEECVAKLASIPVANLPQCVRCGIAPAMTVNGEESFWGMDVGANLSGELKKLLGVNLAITDTGKRCEADSRKGAST